MRDYEKFSTFNFQLSTRNGSLLLDALLSISIFGLIVASFSTGLSGGQQGVIRGGNRVRATYLAEEGLEAVRSIRDRPGGFTTISARPLNQEDGVAFSGADWVIVENPTTIDSTFTRSIMFLAGPDANTRKVVSKVTWTENPGNQMLSYLAETYLTNWRGSVVAPTVDWSLACVEDSEPNPWEDNLVGIYVEGNYAYVSGNNADGFYIANITDPNNLSWVDREDIFITPGTAGLRDVEKKESYAYVANGLTSAELVVVDASTINLGISAPRTSINPTGIGGGRGLQRIGNTLYFIRERDDGAGASEYIEYDVTTASTPSQIAGRELSIDRDTYSIALSSNYAYIATNNAAQELSVVNGNVSPPVLSGGGDPGTQAGGQARGHSTAVLGSTAYLGVNYDYPYEFYAFDMSSTPGSPPPPGGSSGYDTGGTSGGGSVYDIAISSSPSVAFLATDARAAGNTEWWYFQAVDLSKNNGLNIQNERLAYIDMKPVGRMPGATDGAKGIAFRASDNTVYLVGGSYLVSMKPGGCVP